MVKRCRFFFDDFRVVNLRIVNGEFVYFLIEFVASDIVDLSKELNTRLEDFVLLCFLHV